MQLPEELRSPRAVSIALGILGSMVALTIVKDLTPAQKVAMVVTGSVSAAICAPPVIALVNAPDGWSNIISFLIGGIGWVTMGKLISMIRDADVWGLVSGIVRSWLERR